jgi:hypothetical protein
LHKKKLITLKASVMRNEMKKYFIENAGAFVTMNDSDFNELCAYETDLLQIPAILFVRRGYTYNGDEVVLTHKELKTILRTTINNSIN